VQEKHLFWKVVTSDHPGVMHLYFNWNIFFRALHSEILDTN